MIGAWFKRMMPKGLYGRAALILIVPILTVQLVVSVVFVQRYFTDVTRQMTDAILPELRLIGASARSVESGADGLEEARRLAGRLGMDLTQGELAPAGDARVFYDFSGRVVIREMRQALPDLVALDLSDLRTVRMWFKGPNGAYQLTLSRNRVTARNPHQLLVYMLATGLLMTVIAYFFLRNQLRPIRRLAHAAEEFGKGRSATYRIAGATEVRAAGAAFLDMRARIERQMEQRTLMLSGVSHDLRTPLTRLKLGLAMLGDSAEVRALERDVDDMRKMLDGFLAFARSDAQEGASDVVDPVDLARRVAEDARRGGGDVTLASIEGEGTALWRSGAVRRALDNLVSNATTFGQKVEISVNILERSVRFTVEDDGPGIPEAQREEALKPFTRLVPGRNQDQGSGVGLGLAITVDIARSHGGSLRLGDSARLGGLKAELVLAR
jgi:two-component system osmolarity sensor histidine kinase EnvZ